MNLKLLAEPFPANDIEWRVGQAGQNKKGIWCKVLAYITNRAIMERLDEVCGPDNWRNEYRHEPSGAIMCGLSIRITNQATANEWVTKWDGAEATDIEAVKGGLSNAMKRAGVQWGIGRYLYQLEEGWAEISEQGEHYQPASTKAGKEYPAFRWTPPKLPTWALPTPEGNEKPAAPNPKPATAPTTSAVTKPADRLVRGKRLADYSKEELNDMLTALHKEGKAKHKDLLGDIGTVLGDLITQPKVKLPADENGRGEALLAMSNAAGRATDGLPFD